MDFVRYFQFETAVNFNSRDMNMAAKWRQIEKNVSGGFSLRSSQHFE